MFHEIPAFDLRPYAYYAVPCINIVDVIPEELPS
jgi:hypothetical protein